MEFLLASSIPNIDLDAFVLVRDGFGEELDTDGRCSGLGELTVGIADGELCLTGATVADHDHLEC
jgi:hypothetical protein